MLIGVLYGKVIGREMRGLKSNQLSEVPKNLFKLVYGVVTAFGLFFVTLFGSLIFFQLLGVITVGDEIGPLLFPLSIFIAITPNIHARYLSRKDFKLTTKLQSLTDTCPTDRVDEAINHLDHRRYPVRLAAARVLLSIVSDNPGKAVKYSSKDPEALCNKLIQRIQKDDQEVQEISLRCLSWLSRDYEHLLLPYAKLFANLVRSDHTPFQVNSTIILGNLELSEQDKIEKCAQAIKPAVKDPDADVRHAAAVALGTAPCENSLRMLDHLTEDSDSDVRQRASQSLQKLNRSCGVDCW